MPRIIKKGSTDIIDYIVIRDSTTGAPETGVTITDLDLQYVRNGVAPSTKVDATALAAIDSAHGDNKMIAVDDTDQPGLHRVDWPDAAFASGVDQVVCTVKGTGFDPAHREFQLVDFDPEDAVRLGLTALPNAAANAAGGLPKSTAGGLDLDAKLANTNEITAARMGALTDWINGGRLDLILDELTSQGDTNDSKLDVIAGYIDAEITAIINHLLDIKGTGFVKDTDSLPQCLTATGFSTHSVENVRTEMDSNSTQLASLITRLTAVRAGYLDNLNGHTAQSADNDTKLTTIAGYLDTEIQTITNYVDTLEATLANGTYGLAALKTLIDTINNFVDTEIGAIITHLTDIKGTDFVKDTHSQPQCLTGAGGSAPTVVEIRTEMDNNSTQFTALVARLTAARAGYLDKLNVTGALAHSDAAATYKADVSALATAVALAALNNISSGEVNTACDMALADYGANTIVPDAAGTAPTSAEIVTALIAGIADGSYDLQEMMRIVFAAACCKINGGGTDTINVRDSADSKNRVVVTVDENGNRTAVTLDGS